jgi:hypothetical protein
MNENMTVGQVRHKRTTIQKNISKLTNQLLDLQNLCKHPNVEKKFCGSSGNYDPSLDAYWINWYCPDCGKHWTTDQDRENILKPGKIIR